MLRDTLERVRARIERACQRCGRPPSAVTLIAVTKGIAVEAMREAIALGLSDIGENRVQEARDKHAQLSRGARWHLIGHLQRNKAKDALELFDVIHSVDSVPLIEELERRAAERIPGPGSTVEGQGNRKEIFVQVNVSGEMSKFGCKPDEALALCGTMRQQSHLHLRGLMTIAPWSDDPERARPHFRALRLLRDAASAALSLPPRTLNLSMGMSQDFEVAIEEGADFVRIGTALFGTRP